MSARKVLVIGLDGATFDIVLPLMEQGLLPRISGMIRSGARARLKSTVMPNSFPAWTSLTTGVNPGKHGIFWPLIRENAGSTALRLMSAADIKARRIWHYLENAGFRVGTFNVPTEYPPTPLNGFCVSGALTPAISSAFTYPPGLKDEILDIVPSYRCEIEFAGLSREKMAAELTSSIEKRVAVLLHLLRTRPWDFVLAVFTESDLVQHRYWAGIDSRHPEFRRFGEQRTLVHDVYRRLDAAVGKLADALPAGAAVVLVSDHGFGPFYQSFSLPLWLRDRGYLALADGGAKTAAASALKKIGLYPTVQKIKDGLASASRRIRGQADVRSAREEDALAGGDMLARIDWPRTRAYFTPDYGIRLNLAGREPSGIVSPGSEERRLATEIRDSLSRLSYSNGRPVFEAVLTKEDAFSGPWVDRAADLIVPVDYAAAPPRPEQWPYTLTHPSLNGTHSPFGILIASGPGIRRGVEIAGADLIDVAPTILSYFGIAPAGNLDGRILSELFVETSSGGA